jgi:hypothetical protein
MDPILRSELQHRYDRCVQAVSLSKGNKGAQMLCIKSVFESRGIQVSIRSSTRKQ